MVIGQFQPSVKLRRSLLLTGFIDVVNKVICKVPVVADYIYREDYVLSWYNI